MLHKCVLFCKQLSAFLCTLHCQLSVRDGRVSALRDSSLHENVPVRPHAHKGNSLHSREHENVQAYFQLTLRVRFPEKKRDLACLDHDDGKRLQGVGRREQYR